MKPVEQEVGEKEKEWTGNKSLFNATFTFVEIKKRLVQWMNVLFGIEVKKYVWKNKMGYWLCDLCLFQLSKQLYIDSFFSWHFDSLCYLTHNKYITYNLLCLSICP